MSELRSPYVSRYQRGTIASLILLLVLAAAGAALLVWAGSLLLAELKHDWTETSGNVTAEGTMEVTVGSLGNERIEEQRSVTVEFTFNGEQLSAEAPSDTAQLGDQLRVWVDANEVTSIELVQPEGVTTGHWLAVGVFALLVLLPLLGVITRIRRAAAIAGFSAAHASDGFTLEVTDLIERAYNPQGPARGRNLAREMAGVIRTSEASALSPGASLTIIARSRLCPTLQELAGPAEGYLLVRGLMTWQAAVRRQGTEDWWIGTVRKPG